jgi:CheY-like chemotaxis protein
LVSAAIRDISELIQAEDALQKAKLIADSALAIKSRFLATASHDLRQPLHSLMLFNKALSKSINDPKLPIKPILERVNSEFQNEAADKGLELNVLYASELLLFLEPKFDIKTAATPEAALAILDELDVDLIITDFHLNHAQTGVDIITNIRRYSNRMIPAILVSGDTPPAMDQMVIEHNNIELMTKPLDPIKLI